MSGVELQGTVAPGFERVADAFLANFAQHGDVGAACCLHLDGEPVVDVWGGLADQATGRPWARDTIVIVFSCTKGVTAVAANQGRDPYQVIDETMPEGPSPVMFLPHLNGSGTPTCDLHSKGAVVGLTLATTRHDIAKAILEGLTFELRTLKPAPP